MSIAVSTLDGGGGEDPQPSPIGLVPTPFPPVPPSFWVLSSSFTFPGSSTNAVPPPRPGVAPSSNFSFPGAPPSSSAPTYASSTPRFAYPSPVPSGISPVPPFATAPGGFSYQVLSNAVPQATAVSAVPPDSLGGDTQPASAPSLDIGRLALNSQNVASDGSPLQPYLDSAQPQGQASDVVLPPASSVQNLPGPPLIGAVPLRPGLIPPPSVTMSVVPPHPLYPANLLPGVPMIPPGVLGSAPFGAMVRPPGFPMRAPSPLGRPVIRPGIIVRPPLVVEKPQTLCYVGKIAPTVDDAFLNSVLELCGPVKSWKRAQELAVGSFGFCEFETAEGVMRALRLLNGFNLDGREIKLTVTQAARDSLERYLQRKEKEQQQKLEAMKALEMEVETAPGVEAPDQPIKLDIPKPSKRDVPVEEAATKEKRFGIISKEDNEADEEALEKLIGLLEERAKVIPPPSEAPPMCSTPDAPSDTPTKDGKSNGLGGQTDEETKEIKGSSELDKAEMSSPDRERQEGMEHGKDDSRECRDRDRDREWSRDRGRDRERERERERRKEKERQIDQAERERERNRARREREQYLQTRYADRRYEDSKRYWASKEKERERRRNSDKEREREIEKQRRKLIKVQEEDSDDEGWSKSRRRGEERKRIQREREDDERDRIEEEEEVEAKRRKLNEEYEEKVKKRLEEAAKAEAASCSVGSEGEVKEAQNERDVTASSHNNEQIATANGNGVSTNGMPDIAIDESEGVPMSIDVGDKQTSSPVLRKLGFGLVGSGKRAAVPSVFHQEDEEEEPKDRGIRPLVPIDYSNEEMQAVSSLKANSSPGKAHLAAAAEFAKTLSNLGDRVDHKEHSGKDRETGGRKERNRGRERDRDKPRDSDDSHEKDKKLDAKQLIDSIPKTRDELFAYKINWQIFDQHKLHERLRPWIQKKIVEFLGEEEKTFVDFIVSNMCKHETAATILGLLTNILDDEAEMFVMKMWRMLIFEIKKVLGLAPPGM